MSPRFGFLCLLLLTLPACSDTSSSGADKPSAKVVATPVDPATAGSITVHVRYDGPVPEAKVLNMRNAPQCAAAHAEPVKDTTFLVQDGNLMNAVVWIKGGLENWTFAPPTSPVLVDQKGCIYSPRVVAAMVGQPVEFRNSDPEPHNVHGKPKVVSGWNFMISRQGATRAVTFDKEEIAIPVGCDIHPWMTGYVAVTRTPYASVSGKDGMATLKNVPPGKYTIGVWHEKLGSKELTVSLDPSAQISEQLTFGAAQ